LSFRMQSATLGQHSSRRNSARGSLPSMEVFWLAPIVELWRTIGAARATARSSVCVRASAREGGTQSAQGCRPPRYPRRGLTFICSLPGHKSHRPRDSSQACAWPAMPSLLCYSHSIRYLYRIETDACQWAEQDILLLLPCPAASVKPLPAAGSMRTEDSHCLSAAGTCMMPVL
jgi:hypothetical protein